MKVKLQNLIKDTIAAVYLPNGNAILPYKGYYDIDREIEYKIVCAKYTYLFINNKLTRYNYL